MPGCTIRKIQLFIRLITITTIFFILIYLIPGNKNQSIYYISSIVIAISTYFLCIPVIDFSKQNNKENKKTLNKIKKTNLIKDNIYPIYYLEEYENYKNILIKTLETINSNQINAFIDKRYVIIIGDLKTLKIFYKSTSVKGLFGKAEKYIILYTEIKKDEENIKITEEDFISTFYHEWGHFVDFYNLFESNTVSFLRKFKSEKSKINASIKILYSNCLEFYTRKNPHTDIYEYINPSEYFATNYSKYKRNKLEDNFLINVFKNIESR